MTTVPETVPTAGARSLQDRCAHNYHPLPIVVASASGSWVTDVNGARYLDCLAAYSALNFGHGHPEIVAAAREQLDRLTLTSRAFDHDQLYEFCAELADLCGKDMVHLHDRSTFMPGATLSLGEFVPYKRAG